jgi:hypothetical protein
MKIWFPNCSLGELLTRNRSASRIISFVVIGFFAGLCGCYLLENHFWLLTIAVLGIASVLLCLGAAVGISLNWSKVDGAPSASIKENVPRITSQWDYRPRKAIRAPAVFDSPGPETSAVLSPNPFVINNNVWCNDDSLECAAPAFIRLRPDGEELMTKVPVGNH